MAGAGFYDFTAGEVLTADAVDTFLMQQSIMVFAGTAQRASALGTLVAEGMHSYISGLGLEFYNGSSWVSAGGGAAGGLETNFLLMGA